MFDQMCGIVLTVTVIWQDDSINVLSWNTNMIWTIQIGDDMCDCFRLNFSNQIKLFESPELSWIFVMNNLMFALKLVNGDG